MKSLVFGFLILLLSSCSQYATREETKAALYQRDEVLKNIVTAIKELQEKTGVRKDAEKGKK